MEKKLNIALLVVAIAFYQAGAQADYALHGSASYVKPQARHDAEFAGASSLHDAVVRNDLSAAESLLKSGSAIDERFNGYTPIMLAVRQRDLPMVTLLLKFNAAITRDQLDRVITDSTDNKKMNPMSLELLDRCVSAVTAKYPNLIKNTGFGATNAAHQMETVMANHTSN